MPRSRSEPAVQLTYPPRTAARLSGLSPRVLSVETPRYRGARGKDPHR